VVADPDADQLDKALKEIYQLYTDYVLKNPFYVMEMPIRIELFDRHVVQLIKDRNVVPVGRQG